jgi:hypothetical protein
MFKLLQKHGAGGGGRAGAFKLLQKHGAGGGGRAGAYDGLDEETYGEVALVLPLMEPVVVAVNAGDGIAAVYVHVVTKTRCGRRGRVQRHEELHDIVT